MAFIEGAGGVEVGWGELEGSDWRSRVTARPRACGLRHQWLKKSWKNPGIFEGNFYEDLLYSGDAKFLPHLSVQSSLK